MSEINIHWKLTAKKNRIQDVARYWFEKSKTTTAQNMHFQGRKKNQPGGVAIMSQGNISLWTSRSKSDSRGMGQWTSQVFHGKANLIDITSCLASNLK